jgi:hypothetical protein
MKCPVSQVSSHRGGGKVRIPRILRDLQVEEEFAHAHAVLTGYQSWTNKQFGEFKRYLVQLWLKAMESVSD